MEKIEVLEGRYINRPASIHTFGERRDKGNPKTKNPESGIRNPGSGIPNPESAIR